MPEAFQGFEACSRILLCHYPRSPNLSHSIAINKWINRRINIDNCKSKVYANPAAIRVVVRFDNKQADRVRKITQNKNTMYYEHVKSVSFSLGHLLMVSSVHFSTYDLSPVITNDSINFDVSHG